MKFTAVYHAWLNSPQVRRMRPADLGNWLRLAAYVAEFGHVDTEGASRDNPMGWGEVDCSGWSRQDWRMICGVPESGVDALTRIGLAIKSPTTLKVLAIDSWGTATRLARKSQGARGGRPRKSADPMRQEKPNGFVEPPITRNQVKSPNQYPTYTLPSDTTYRAANAASLPPEQETILPASNPPPEPPQPSPAAPPRPARKQTEEERQTKKAERESVGKLFDLWVESHLQVGRPRPARWLPSSRDYANARDLLKRLADYPDPVAEAARRIDIALNRPPEYWRGKSFGIGAVLSQLDQFAWEEKPANGSGGNGTGGWVRGWDDRAAELLKEGIDVNKQSYGGEIK